MNFDASRENVKANTRGSPATVYFRVKMCTLRIKSSAFLLRRHNLGQSLFFFVFFFLHKKLQPQCHFKWYTPNARTRVRLCVLMCVCPCACVRAGVCVFACMYVRVDTITCIKCNEYDLLSVLTVKSLTEKNLQKSCNTAFPGSVTLLAQDA